MRARYACMCITVTFSPLPAAKACPWPFTPEVRTPAACRPSPHLPRFPAPDCEESELELGADARLGVEADELRALQPRLGKVRQRLGHGGTEQQALAPVRHATDQINNLGAAAGAAGGYIIHRLNLTPYVAHDVLSPRQPGGGGGSVSGGSRWALSIPLCAPESDAACDA